MLMKKAENAHEKLSSFFMCYFYWLLGQIGCGKIRSKSTKSGTKGKKAVFVAQKQQG